MPNQNAAGNTGAANTTPNDGAPAANAAQAQQAEGSTAQQKTFTQEEVNALVGKVRQDERAKYAGGSSPRVRGTLALHDLALALGGIIPAYAGNTMRPTASHTAPWDHPRVCGEHRLGLSMRSCQLGSSPRVRGTLVDLLGGVRLGGITPACAGNTIDFSAAADAPLGSSPRVRGTLDFKTTEGHTCGIIPACAGTTTSPLRSV